MIVMFSPFSSEFIASEYVRFIFLGKSAKLYREKMLMIATKPNSVVSCIYSYKAAPNAMLDIIGFHALPQNIKMKHLHPKKNIYIVKNVIYNI